MRTTPLVMAAAAAIGIGVAPFAAAPSAHAIPSAACQLEVLQQGVRQNRVMSPAEINAALAACDPQGSQPAQRTQSAQQQKPAAPPPQPGTGPGPCVPKPYIGPNGPVNANCGQTYGECVGDPLITGVACSGVPVDNAPAAGTPAGGGAPAAGGGTPAAGGTPGGTLGLPGGGAPAAEGAPGGGLPSDGKPVTADPQCANLDYFIKFRITCEENGAPYPPGYTPGMNDSPPS
jgi:hypothetical protein